MRRKGWLLLALAFACATAGAATPSASAEGPNAVRPDAGCAQTVLNRNDDGSTGLVPIGFPVNFFGTTYTHLFVNNNGNVTFGSPLSTFTPFGLTGATNRPIIAPFFADVDTRGSGSEVVRYSFGATTIDGHQAFCVNWVNVGYYSGRFDKLNSFQLVLVDRSDVGAGDVDMEFNYDKIQWETGDASGGSNGFGGTSAGAGYSAGAGTPGTFFEFTGSRAPGSLLDSNPLTGLVHGSRNTLQLGRYVFPIRNGAAPVGGAISGLVLDPAGNTVADAIVQVCPSAGGQCTFVTATNAAGAYNATGLPPDTYDVTAFPPAGSNLIRAGAGGLLVSVGSSTIQNVTLGGPVPPPANVSLSPIRSGGGGVPVLYWGDSLDLSITGCTGGTASYVVQVGATDVASGPMAEGPTGTYAATIPPLRPSSGVGSISIRLACPNPADDQAPTFAVYIDPSGLVRTPGGNAVEGATVTLYRSDSAIGPFVAVPDGSAIMSPLNRRNPDLTDAFGHFGWDVIAGFYKVRAEKADCHAVGNPGQPFVETEVLPVPPIWLDLDLRLEGPGCPDDVTPPVLALPADITVDATGPAGASVTYEATAHDEVDGAVAPDCAPPSGSLFPIGTSTVTCTATDAAGNTSEPGTFSVHVRGAAAQLAALAADSRGVGPGQSLERKASSALADVTAGDLAGACETLTGYRNEIRAQTGKSVPADTAAELSADAARIMAVLGC